MFLCSPCCRKDSVCGSVEVSVHQTSFCFEAPSLYCKGCSLGVQLVSEKQLIKEFKGTAAAVLGCWGTGSQVSEFWHAIPMLCNQLPCTGYLFHISLSYINFLIYKLTKNSGKITSIHIVLLRSSIAAQVQNCSSFP